MIYCLLGSTTSHTPIPSYLPFLHQILFLAPPPPSSPNTFSGTTTTRIFRMSPPTVKSQPRRLLSSPFLNSSYKHKHTLHQIYSPIKPKTAFHRKIEAWLVPLIQSSFFLSYPLTLNMIWLISNDSIPFFSIIFINSNNHSSGALKSTLTKKNG